MDINFKKLTEKYKEEALETLKKDVSINSAYDASTIDIKALAPYGKGVKACFDFLAELALKDGFSVDRCDGRCLEISCGSGERLIGVFAHQDVVPVAEGWKFGAFNPTVYEDRLYGRGTSDDKGPGIAAYYALKALKDNDLIKNFRVKLVFGGDEERGSSCLNYYFHTLKKEDPTYAFTPDADFPVIYGEKGLVVYSLTGKIHYNEIVSIKAGSASNIVPDRCEVVVKDASKLDEYLSKKSGIKYEKVSENKYAFLGKAAHAAKPDAGINAVVIALSVLGDVYQEATLSLLANEYVDNSGKNLGAFVASPNLGETTYNLGIISYENDSFSAIINMRYPETYVVKKEMEKIQKVSPFTLKIESVAECLYFDPETKWIKSLYKIYQEETGDSETKMLTIGGGTYAKEVKNCVAFGSCFPGKIDNIHEIDEKIDLCDFYNSMPIYAHAIYALGTLYED